MTRTKTQEELAFDKELARYTPMRGKYTLMLLVNGDTVCSACGRRWNYAVHLRDTPKLRERCPSDDCPSNERR
jgi:hypothetical protein